MLNRLTAVCVGLAALTGCATESGGDAPLTRDEARRQAKEDSATDFCALFNWYTDDVCDEFCLEPDPVCESECRSDDDCSPIFCITTPCPQNVCLDGECTIDLPDPECQPVLCEIYCPYGFAVGEDGCEICSCMDPPEETCMSNSDCGSGQYCDAPTGTCGEPGICADIPLDVVCGQAITTYCSCEGETIHNSNTCVFDRVDHYGECDEPAPRTCGDRGATGCNEDEYCDFNFMCGRADGGGICRPRPDVCNEVHAPVCGCDNQTYSNACMAASVGVDVASQGACECQPVLCTLFCEHGFQTDDDGCQVCRCAEAPPSFDFCGGLLGLGCELDEFCDYPDDAMCGAADQTGTCEPIPDVCPTVVTPVCGCDGRTYNNACDAHRHGVDAARSGEC